MLRRRVLRLKAPRLQFAVIMGTRMSKAEYKAVEVELARLRSIMEGLDAAELIIQNPPAKCSILLDRQFL
jgi:hypothetical protein